MNLRQTLFLLLKVCFAGGILWWLFGKIDAVRLWDLLGATKLGPLAGAVGAMVGTVFIASWRWRKLLEIFGIHALLRSLLCIAWIGQFFMMFLPGPLGDDASRMIYISRAAPGRAGEACLSVMVDRVIGLTSVLVLCLFVVPLQWVVLRTVPQTFWMAGGVFLSGLGFLVIGLLFLVLARPLSGKGGLFELVPHGKIHTELVRLWNLGTGNKHVICQVFAAAIVTQLLNCVAFWFAGLAVGIPLPLLAWASFVPIVLASNVLPVTIAGLGIREYLLVLFLGVIGSIDKEQALAASLVVFASMVIVSSIGGLIYVFYRSSTDKMATDLI